MAGVTFVLALIFGFLALSRKSGGAAVGVMVMSMMVWPEYLRFSLGIAEVSATAFVAMLLLFKGIASGRNREKQISAVDGWVLFLWFWIVLATFLAGANANQVIQMVGRGLDTVLIYFVARMMLQSQDDIKGLFFWLGLTAVVMCCLGVYESVTSYSPYSSLIKYKGWQWIEKADSYRHGFKRANVSTSVHIYFGMAMMIIFGMLLSLRGYVSKNFIYKVAILAGFVAALSSLSSGPWLACLIVIGSLLVFEPRPRLIKPAIYTLLLISLGLELASNRHFYNLIDYLALDSHTAWYRTKLMEVGFANWRDYWLVGVGANWPHHWAEMLDGRDHIDVVNYYLILALYGGVAATVMYVTTHVLAVRAVLKSWPSQRESGNRKLLFGLTATLIALDFSSFSVGLFGPVLILSYLLLGFIVSASSIGTRPEFGAMYKSDVM